MSLFLAGSISRYLHESTPNSLALRVLSRHRRVVNLMDEKGGMWAVVHPDVGNGPFHIVLADAASFDGWEPGATGRWDGRALMIRNGQVDATAARVWDPFLARTPMIIPDRSWELARACASAILAASPPQAEMDARTWARLQEGVIRLGKARRTGDETALLDAAGLLAGLGPGLTPAGDDVLLGWLARAWLGNNMDGTWAAGRLMDAVEGRTTRVSEAWLGHAAAGRFAEPWHDLRSALARADGEAICRTMSRIASIGATSGRLALLGAFPSP